MTKKFLLIICCWCIIFTIPVSALLSDWTLGDSSVIEARPEGQMLSDSGRMDAFGNMLSSFKGLVEIDSEIFEYVYDYSIADRLDLADYHEIISNELVLADYTYTPEMLAVAQELNTTLASIYMRYIEKSDLPLKDPLWFIAIGSIEYNYTINDPHLIFSLPADLEAAKNSANYLLEYDWREVQRIGGDSAVLRRDGSSIGLFQLTGGYGVGYSPIIPEDFGIIGNTKEDRRSDCWLTLGDGNNSGAAIVWKPGVDGDRWSPADCANLMCGVYTSYLKNKPFPPELGDKYEQAILLMWSHNRGVGIINNSTYIFRSKALAEAVPELLTFVEEVKPIRFMRTATLMNKVRELADRYTDGEQYPVMALMSYLITECRYSGKW